MSSVAHDRKLAIETWLADRLHDAQILSADHGVAARADRRKSGLERQAGDPCPLVPEITRLYESSFVFDADGVVLFSCPHGPLPIGAAQMRRLVDDDRRLSARTLLVENEVRKGPALLFIAPILDQAGGGEHLGNVALMTDPELWLYPAIRREAVRSETVETLLVKRDGDSILALSPLRHVSGRPLMRQPLRDPILAAQAALALEESVGWYSDYRGVRVLTATRRIAGTGWALVTKVDEREVLDPARWKVAAGAGAVMSFTVILFIAGLLLMRSRHLRHRVEMTQAEARFTHLFEYANDAILVLARDGAILSANGAAGALYGRTSEELCAMNISDLRLEETRSLVPAQMREAERRGVRFETIHLDREGRRIDVEVSCKLLSIGSEQVFVSIVRNNMERKAAGERIRTLNRLLATTREITKLTVRGLSRKQLFDETCRILVEHGEFRMAWIGLADRSTGRVVPAAQSGVVNGYLDRIEVRFDDTEFGRGPIGTSIRENRAVVTQDFSAETSLAPWHALSEEHGFASLGAFPLAVNGSVIGAMAVYASTQGVFDVEVCELLDDMAADLSFALAVNANEDEVRRLAAAVEQASESIIITDVDGRIEYVNPAFTRVSGYTRAEVIGEKPSILKSGRHDGEFYARLWNTIRGGEAWEGHFSNRRKDGTLYEEEATISPIRGTGGEIVSFVAVKRDVTQEIAMELRLRQAQKMEAIGNLAGGVAHDFNNLLQAFTSQLTLLRRRCPTVEAAGPIDLLCDQVRRGSSLTRQLLLFSRREAVTVETFDLNELFRGTARMLRHLVRENIQFGTNFDPQPLLVNGDRGEMEQVLMNLVVNATDAMPAGGHLVVSTYGAADRCSLRVADTGMGIPREVRDHIFEPFFTTKAAGLGTGLGLAVVHGIVARCGGEITFESEVGIGTTFTVDLPLAVSMPGPLPPEPAADEWAGAGQTVLLVEDDENVREGLSMVLEAYGYSVVAVHSAEAVEDLPDDTTPSLLLTDVVLPGCPGPLLADQLVRRWSGLRVIFMSGYTDQQTIPASIGGRTVSLLRKPFPNSELLESIQKALAS